MRYTRAAQWPPGRRGGENNTCAPSVLKLTVKAGSVGALSGCGRHTTCHSVRESGDEVVPELEFA